MINGAHVIIFSTDAEADRAFIRDVLGFASVDAGDGWLIFKLPPAEVAVHPADAAGGQAGHQLSLMCDDLAQTLAVLAGKGTPVSPVSSARWGTSATITLPGGSELMIYQPAHAVAHGLA